MESPLQLPASSPVLTVLSPCEKALPGSATEGRGLTRAQRVIWGRGVTSRQTRCAAGPLRWEGVALRVLGRSFWVLPARPTSGLLRDVIPGECGALEGQVLGLPDAPRALPRMIRSVWSYAARSIAPRCVVYWPCSINQHLKRTRASACSGAPCPGYRRASL